MSGPNTDDGPAEDGTPPAGEAARYRRRLREVEAERDALLDHVHRYQRMEITARAEAAGLHRGADLLTVHDAAALTDDAGAVDGEQITQAVEALLSERPHWARQHRPPPSLGPVEALRGGLDPDAGPAGWSQLIGRAARS